MKTRWAITAAVVLLAAACCSPYLLPALYLDVAGLTTEGKVVQKREAIEMRSFDEYRHVFEVTYSYIPLGARVAESGTHQVSADLYGRLQPGSRVRVQYAPWQLLRSLHMVAMGSALVDASWASRLPGGDGAYRTLIDLGAIAAAVLLGLWAWLRKTQPWILLAAFATGIVVAGVFTAAFVSIPLLFAVARKWPRQGLGWALAAVTLLTPAVIYWRIPRPSAFGHGPTVEVAAKVVHVQSVDHIWSGPEDSGQDLRDPFQMLDLEFAPEGASEPVHALDRIDLNSIPGLHDGSAVRVAYLVSEPRAARIEGGTRTYPMNALAQILEMNFVIGSGVLAFLWLAMAIEARIRRGMNSFFTTISSGRVQDNLSRLSADDPRRRVVERLLGARK